MLSRANPESFSEILLDVGEWGRVKGRRISMIKAMMNLDKLWLSV